MVDLSALKLVPEQIELADDAAYIDASEFGPPPDEGTYTFSQGRPTFSATDKGYLQAMMTHKFAGGDYDGKDFPFDRISNKPFDRQGVKVSMMNDHLRAVYASADRPRPRTHDEYAQALEASEGKPFKAALQWEAGCRHESTPQECEWTDDKVWRVRGARSFPQNGNGKPATEIKCETCGTVVQARARISRRIAAS